jgi:hypothetical protein
MLRTSLIVIIVLLYACKGGKDKPDVSGINVNTSVVRFENDFFRIDTNNIAPGLPALRSKYPELYGPFFSQFLGIPPGVEADPQSGARQHIAGFIAAHRSLYDSVQAKYRDLGWLESDLEEALRYVKFYYPDYKIPRFITYVGPFDAPGIAVLSGAIGIGLQQFAGKNFSFYTDAMILEMYPRYISRRFDKEYMVPNCLGGVVSEIYADSSAGRALIDQMIEKGKQWYLLDKFLPDTEDTLKTGYTGTQQAWCEKYEGTIWSEIIKNEDIFSIDPETIQKYIGPGPFTQNMPEASPGNLGQWVGWRMVQAYADRNPKMTLQQILAMPARTIFHSSKYKPK